MITDVLSAITGTFSAILGSGNVITEIPFLITENIPVITAFNRLIKIQKNVMACFRPVITDREFAITDIGQVMTNNGNVMA